VSKAVEKFKEIASQPRFRGWPLVGEYELGAKIPFFGQVVRYKLQTGNGIEEYASILRHFGWSVCFGVTTEGNVITNIQWKPGINEVEWGLSPGGIGRVGPNATEAEVLQKTKEFFLKETGYGNGTWTYLGCGMVDSGKFRGADPNDHGLPAHMFLAVDLEREQEPQPLPNEIMEKLHVPLEEFAEVLHARPRLFNEISAIACAYAAREELRRLGRL